MTNSGVFLNSWGIAGLALVVVSIILTAAIIKLLYPALLRIAVVLPNARSSHKTPTPQGAGIAVMASTTILVALTVYFFPNLTDDPGRIVSILGAAALLAVVGAFDDIRALDVLPRLLLQVVAIGIVIAALPSDLRIVSVFSWWFERALLLIGGLWFVNMVNFMDGIDWMTVAEIVPVTGALGLFGLMGELPADATLVAFGLCGAMLGFAPFNRPVARVFLGDVGSLPIGLLLVWLLALLADRHLAAALLLPLYYVADATVTLLRRLAKGERVTQAHRSHFYQRATDNGFSVMQIVARVFVLNIALVLLAAATVLMPWRPLHIAAFVVGCGLVSLLLYRFAKPQ